LRLVLVVAAALVSILLDTGGYPAADDSESEIYPSEEELLDACLLGAIDYPSYMNLVEILREDPEGGDMSLAADLPQVFFLLNTYAGGRISSDLDVSGIEDGNNKDRHGIFRFRQSQRMEPVGNDRMDGYLKADLGSKLQVKLGFNDNGDGAARITRRSLVYRSRRGFIRKAVLGNFRTKFGLGVNVGYRGRLLDKPGGDWGESFWFPRYGGFNGLLIRGNKRYGNIGLLIHADRDRDIAFNAIAVCTGGRLGRLQWEMIVSGGRLKSSRSESVYRFVKPGLTLRFSARKIKLAGEVCYPSGSSGVIPAGVLEAGYRPGKSDWFLSLWHYGRDFINLTGGGRSGSMYRSVRPGLPDFDFSDRRVDQRGVILKSRAEIIAGVRTNLTLTLYGQDRFNKTTELISGLDYFMGVDSRVAVVYRCVRKEDVGGLRTKNEIRLSASRDWAGFSNRGHIGYLAGHDAERFLTILVQSSWSPDATGPFRVRINLGRFNLESSRIDYFYGYFRHTVHLSEAIELGTRYSFRYNRTYTDRCRSTLWMESRVVW